MKNRQTDRQDKFVIEIYISITNLSCLDIFVIDIYICYKFVLSICLSVSHQLRVCEPKSWHGSYLYMLRILKNGPSVCQEKCFFLKIGRFEGDPAKFPPNGPLQNFFVQNNVISGHFYWKYIKKQEYKISHKNIENWHAYQHYSS